MCFLITDMQPKLVILGQIADFEMGQSPDSHYVNESGAGFPFLQGAADFREINPSHTTYCSRPKKLCQIGDILISVRAPVGTLNKADKVYCIGRGLAALKFKKGTLQEFGWYLMNFWATSLRTVAQGTTFEAIGKQELSELKVLSLALAEQQRVAETLDTMDEAIQKTEALIAKLKAMKQGLLNDLLTRGLDENGHLRDPKTHPEQFKDSRLGRIPMDWDIYTLGSLSDQISYGFTNPMPTTANGPWMITAFDIADGYIRYEQARHTSERAYMHELTSKSRPIIGGLLITKDGTLGRVAIVDRKNICINQSVACVTLSPKADIGYLFHYLRSELAQRDMLAEAGGSTIKHIYITKLALMEIPVPPKSERNKIKDIMDYYETRFQAEERYRDKLKSIKKGLMNDLLTGKVRVWSEEH